MKLPSLLIFDFDGVIVDGMDEYWRSSRSACINLFKGHVDPNSLPLEVPESFVELRPCVQHGWEMVLLAAELLREDGPLRAQGASEFAESYLRYCNEALKFWGMEPVVFQDALENARRSAIVADKNAWFALHKPYSWVLDRCPQFASERVDWAVLTTKGSEFAAELLNYFGLSPNNIYGHESGSKIDVLQKISEEFLIQGFIEDRRLTLEAVLASSKLPSIPCYLASWGYLKPLDKENLPKGIFLLSPEIMSAPLASWV